MKLIRLKVRKGKVSYFCIDGTYILGMTIPIVMGCLVAFTPESVFAVTAREKVDKAVQPIIDTIKAAAKPICYGSALWGWSKVMLGQKKEGYGQIKGAAWGYVGVQLTPWLFGIIQDIGSGVK